LGEKLLCNFESIEKYLKKIYFFRPIIIKSNIIYIFTMPVIWIDHVKAYDEKNKISYKQALKDASLSYKALEEMTKNKKNQKIEEPKIEPPLEKEKPKRKNNKKVVEIITLKL
jgi:hypothetical protein